MDISHKEFRARLHELADWVADFREGVSKYPAKSQVAPGYLLDQIGDEAPQQGEPFDRIMQDFEELIMPGITHWQHPGFFAYFPSNASRISLLAELLTSALGTQCMIWDTSPAAAELEEKMMHWLRDLLGLPKDWEGVIQDTASTATLVALLCAREKATAWASNKHGMQSLPALRIYVSTETHSSIEKAVKIAGLGSENLVKIETDEYLTMDPRKLEEAILIDRAAGRIPMAVVGSFGTTSTTAVDPVKPIGEICQREDIWYHVDAAYAGSALALPEFRSLSEGMELANSFVFNPHKWLFTHFDCTAYFVQDREALIRTLTILPEYLKTQKRSRGNDYRDWGIPLGRRFRALKLWFVLRHFGQDGIRAALRQHMKLAENLESWMNADERFEILAPRNFNLVVFRLSPSSMTEAQKEILNQKLLESLNADGRLYLTHTRVQAKYALRIVTAQTDLTEDYLQDCWHFILDRTEVLMTET